MAIQAIRKFGPIVERSFERIPGPNDPRIRPDNKELRGPPSAASTSDSVTVIRTRTQSDTNFVVDSWAASYRSSPDVTAMDPEIYKVEVRAYIKSVLKTSSLFVACDQSAPDDIRGYVVCERPREKGGLWLVHYVLVKPEWQRQGIGTALLAPLRANSPDGMLWATSWTIGLKWFATDYLIRNRFIDGRRR